MIAALAAEVRYAFRTLRKSGGFTLAAVGTLAIGIGASTAISSVVRAALLKPLPFRRPDRLVALAVWNRAHTDRMALSPSEFRDFRDGTNAFSGLAATAPFDSNLSAGEGPARRVRGLRVTPNFFAVLGVSAGRGRVLSPGDTRDERLAVVSDALWRRELGGRGDIVGTKIRLDGEPYTVVGVAAPGFSWGRAYGRNSRADVWTPFLLTPARLGSDQRRNEYLDAVGRLRDGATISQAQKEIALVARSFPSRFPSLYPPEENFSPVVTPLHDDQVSAVRPPLLLLAGAVALFLLIAVANVAALAATRSAGRSRELAIRVSQGATAGRLGRQILVECSVLGLLGGAAGTVLSEALVAAVRSWAPPEVAGLQSVRVDGGALAICAVISLLAGVLCGIVPAWLARRADSAVLRTAASTTASRSGAGFRRVLAASQLAVALPVLAVAAMLVGSLRRILDRSPGFDPNSVLAFQVALPRAGYESAQTRTAYFRALENRIQALPGVRVAAAIEELPLGTEVNSSSFEIEGRPTPVGDSGPHAEAWIATPRYFEALRIPLRRGRFFDAHDDSSSEPVAIVDEELARRYFGRSDPLGQRIDFEGDSESPRWRRIVGVVGNVKARDLDESSRPELYVPHAQRAARRMYVVIRTSGDPSRLARPVQELVARMDRSVAVFDVSPMTRVLAGSLATRQFVSGLLSAFGLAGLFLAALGVAAVTAQWIGSRIREIGVRIALGARPSTIVALVLAQAGGVIGVGFAFGAVFAVAGASLLRSRIAEIPAPDSASLAAAVSLFAAAALAAALIPARRAARVDPIEALRTE